MRAPRRASSSAQVVPSPCSWERLGSPASTRRTGPCWRSRPGYGCTAWRLPRCRRASVPTSPSCAGRELLANLLREHEADVLLHHFELGDVLGAARAEEVDQPLNELLGRARAGADPNDPLALQPLLAHLRLAVDQVGVGAMVARDLHQPVRV